MTEFTNNFDGMDLALPGVDAQPAKGRAKRPKKAKEPRQKRQRAPKPARVKKDKAPKQKGGRRNDSKRMMLIAFVVGLVAVGGAYLALNSADGPVDGGYIVRAARDIRPGVDAPAAAFEAVFIPTEALEAGAITGATAEQALARAAGDEPALDGSDVTVIGRRPLFPILEGQTVRPEAFSGVEVSFNRELLSDERLVSVSATASSALGGALVVGELVDVVVAFGDSAAVLVEGAEIVGISADESAFRTAAQRQNSEEGAELSPGEVLPVDPIPGIYSIIVKDFQVLPVVAADAESGAAIYLLGRGENASQLRPADSFVDYTCRAVDTAGIADNAFCLEHQLDMAERNADLAVVVADSATSAE